MNLPNGDRAVVDISKLRDYCLNPQHDQGKAKARVFMSALGIAAVNVAEFHGWLLKAAISAEAILGVKDAFGQRYIVDFQVTYRTRTAKVRSAWIVRAGEDFPRLVTCYVL